MDKTLEKIRKRSGELLGDYPAQREELVKKLQEAEATRSRAHAALIAADDLESYDNATEALNRAELAVRFAKGAVDKLDAAPRMKEEEYRKAINACAGIMSQAVDTYRVKAKALMDQLKALTDEYTQTAEEVNGTLVKLDEAANVLQSKYPYKIHKFQGMPDRKELDKRAWLDHALRYEGYTACTLATTCAPEEIAEHPHKTQDSVLTAAWQAVQRGYPHRSF